jgi:2-C-methyl-D-erythritol 4-phosphate cytidylyltransferase
MKKDFHLLYLPVDQTIICLNRRKRISMETMQRKPLRMIITPETRMIGKDLSNE